MHFLYFLIFISTLLLPTASTLKSNLEILRSLDDEPVLYFTISRRGGEFASADPGEEVANFSYLEEELHRVEGRFNLTRREVKGNKLVRKVKEKGVGGNEAGRLMGEVAGQGRWYATIGIGEPPQEVEVDLDMLTSDFYVVTTTSNRGSRYDDLFSQSNVKSNQRPFPTCSLPSDSFFLPTIQTFVSLSFAYCRPLKSSIHTLDPSGSILGLAPSEHLSQIASPSFLDQLVQKGIVKRPIFSIMLINGREGVLSVGGTTAGAVDLVDQQTKEKLDRAGGLSTEPSQDNLELAKRELGKVTDVKSHHAEWQEGWKWSKVQGAEGWWQILMQGVYVNGDKVLQNQPVVIDINSPFILAPPLAAKAFYASISGALPLPSSPFYIFPCLNPPVLAFEFDGWAFPALKGGKGKDWMGMPGGRFSLGRYEEGSGYCVGAVVESRMGLKGGEGVTSGGKRSEEVEGLAGNGMRGVWVIGEGFFRGVGGVFDFKEQKVGFRTY